MKKLLIIVDYQNDFVNGSLGFPGAADLEDGIAKKIEEYKSDEIIYTLDTHYSDYLTTREGKSLPVTHCVKGSGGHKLYGKIADLLNGKKCFEKNTFPSLEMAKYLEENDYDVIELCGLVSNICVLSNAVMARSACPNAEIIVDANLTASADSDLHEKALDILRGLFITVI
ncbi:MAG: cysteine hydrolase [Oscillospiraceae bacterium]|nr:cysteine hydrolase [Oscillospiraceae bacterium]